MKAIHSVLLVLALATTAVGCERATEEKCREAVRNVFRITQADDTQNAGPDESAAIRSCRANSSRETVECVIAAKSLEDLAACEGGLGKDAPAGEQGANAADGEAPSGDE